MLLGVASATVLALIFGLLAVRTSGVYFLLLTLALGVQGLPQMMAAEK